MKNIYKVTWSNHAAEELKNVFDYLEKNWTLKEKKQLSIKIEKSIELLLLNPEMFPFYLPEKNVRKLVVSKLHTIYYTLNDRNVNIVSFFSNRMNPDNLKL